MADDAVNQAPLTPADLALRHIPEKLLNLAAVDLFRIHRKIPALFFTIAKPHRRCAFAGTRPPIPMACSTMHQN